MQSIIRGLLAAQQAEENELPGREESSMGESDSTEVTNDQNSSNSRKDVMEPNLREPDEGWS